MGDNQSCNYTRTAQYLMSYPEHWRCMNLMHSEPADFQRFSFQHLGTQYNLCQGSGRKIRPQLALARLGIHFALPNSTLPTLLYIKEGIGDIVSGPEFPHHCNLRSTDRRHTHNSNPSKADNEEDDAESTSDEEVDELEPSSEHDRTPRIKKRPRSDFSTVIGTPTDSDKKLNEALATPQAILFCSDGGRGRAAWGTRHGSSITDGEWGQDAEEREVWIDPHNRSSVEVEQILPPHIELYESAKEFEENVDLMVQDGPQASGNLMMPNR
ncbi:hypothetical protein H4582DRAFT_2058379 [Lactarius indigo]|nr:hypothetical protein H4582DRAFT_2058379 [Lactarius indigo]